MPSTVSTVAPMTCAPGPGDPQGVLMAQLVDTLDLATPAASRVGLLDSTKVAQSVSHLGAVDGQRASELSLP